MNYDKVTASRKRTANKFSLTRPKASATTGANVDGSPISHSQSCAVIMVNFSTLYTYEYVLPSSSCSGEGVVSVSTRAKEVQSPQSWESLPLPCTPLKRSRVTFNCQHTAVQQHMANHLRVQRSVSNAPCPTEYPTTPPLSCR